MNAAEPLQRGCLPRAAGVLAGSLSLVLAAAVLTRVGVADRWPPLAPLYYATPPVLLSLGCFAAAWLWRAAGLQRGAHVACLAALAGLAWWGCTAFTHRPHAPAPDDLRVVVWNCQQRVRSDRRLLDTLVAQQPDVIVLVESAARGRRAQQLLDERLPDYARTAVHQQIVVLCRGEMLSTDSGELAPGSYFQQASVRVRGRQLVVLAIDIASDPTTPRGPALARAAELAHAVDRLPVIVAGDFNTPRDSALWRWPAGFASAMDAAGRGYRPTWPQPLPVLEIDHLWINRRWRVTSCRALWTNIGDHRPLVATLAPVEGE